jgi:hypothetical protein
MQVADFAPASSVSWMALLPSTIVDGVSRRATALQPPAVPFCKELEATAGFEQLTSRKTASAGGLSVVRRPKTGCDLPNASEFMSGPHRSETMPTVSTLDDRHVKVAAGL